MKNVIHALAIFGIFLSTAFANETELLKEVTLNPEPVTQVEDQQLNDEMAPNNIHVPLELFMSALKGGTAGMIGVWEISQDIVKQNPQPSDIFKAAIISALINMVVDYVTGSYQEDIWHLQSKKNRAKALRKSIFGTTIGSAITGYYMAQIITSKAPSIIKKEGFFKWFGQVEHARKASGMPGFYAFGCAIIGLAIATTLNGTYQLGEFTYSKYFKKPSEQTDSSEQEQEQDPTLLVQN